jgi:stress-induced morphogen
MYRIHVESAQFAGKNLVAQQRMVNSVLKEQIANMHGLTLTTKVPKA